MLSRKYYELFADILGKYVISSDMLDELCVVFQDDNPQFNKKVFLERIYKRTSATQKSKSTETMAVKART